MHTPRTLFSNQKHAIKIMILEIKNQFKTCNLLQTQKKQPMTCHQNKTHVLRISSKSSDSSITRLANESSPFMSRRKSAGKSSSFHDLPESAAQPSTCCECRPARQGAARLKTKTLKSQTHAPLCGIPIASALQRLLGTLGAQTTETPFPLRVWNENLACRMF